MSVTDRISGKAIEAYQELDGYQQTAVDIFLRDNPKVRLYQIDDVVNAFLVQNGIEGLTRQIVSVVRNSYKVE